MKKVVVMDIETISNFFSYCDLDINTMEERIFIVHEEQNDLMKFVSYLRSISYQIGYNNVAFDSQVIQYILNEYYKWIELSGSEVAQIIYNYSQYVIEKSNGNGWPDFAEWHMSIKQIDLYKIWHYDNKAKRTSLKWIQFAIDYENIEEMPIHHTETVSRGDFTSIIGYNLNDVRSTYEFYKITKGFTNLELYKGVDKLQLRKDIMGEFKINCLNYNDVKIGDELNKLGYCKRTGRDKYQLKPKSVKTEFTFGDCIPDYVKFTSDKFIAFMKHVANCKVNLDKKQEFNLEVNGTTYTIMKGGIHSQDNPRSVEPKANEILRDADIGSQYPNAIRKRKLFPPHLGPEWLEQYTDTIRRRLEAKGLYKKTKDVKYQAIQEAYKLALNGGGFGKTGEESSWQYAPFLSMCVTIGNQFEILMLIEALEENGIHVISANTDGILSLFNKDQEELYNKICKDWEITVGNNDLGQLEYVDYNKFIQTSVNDYIAIKTDGKIKTKGDFVSEFEIHKNKSARIVPLALQAYFAKGIPVRETIENHENIFDFCLGVKSVFGAKFVHLNTKTGEEVGLQKVNRYYVSTSGYNLLKRLKPLEGKRATKQMDIFGSVQDGTRQQEVEAGWLTTIYNKHELRNIEDYSIDYEFYIGKAERIINKINET